MSEFSAGKDVKKRLDTHHPKLRQQPTFTRRELLTDKLRALAKVGIAAAIVGALLRTTADTLLTAGNANSESKKNREIKPTHYFTGPVYLDVEKLDLHENPNFMSNNYGWNVVEPASLVKVGNIDLSNSKGVKIRIDNALVTSGPDPDGPSGATTDWYIIPKTVVRTLGFEDLEKTLYAPKPSSERSGAITRGSGEFVPVIDIQGDTVTLTPRAQSAPRSLPLSEMSVISEVK